jgi:hypothetical protein
VRKCTGHGRGGVDPESDEENERGSGSLRAHVGSG